jgi:hypothetical protein
MLLSLVLMTLKLCGVIDWSWWWVTAPVWVPPVIAFVMFAVAGMLLAYKESIK